MTSEERCIRSTAWWYTAVQKATWKHHECTHRWRTEYATGRTG